MPARNAAATSGRPFHSPPCWTIASRTSSRSSAIRASGYVDLRGDLGGRPVEHVAQDQRRALPGWQELDRGEVGQRDGLARHRPGLGAGLITGQLVEQRA
jgi:hypothetical protein